jgi:hypothetical protein
MNELNLKHEARRRKLFSRNGGVKERPMIRFSKEFAHNLPGVALCAAIGALAYSAQAAEDYFLGGPALEALVLAILIGALGRILWTPSALCLPGRA